PQAMGANFFDEIVAAEDDAQIERIGKNCDHRLLWIKPIERHSDLGRMVGRKKAGNRGANLQLSQDLLGRPSRQRAPGYPAATLIARREESIARKEPFGGFDRIEGEIRLSLRQCRAIRLKVSLRGNLRDGWLNAKRH